MNWQQLLCEQRMRMAHSSHQNEKDLRSPFEKDYHRIIGSPSFRRLQDKTQVFPLDRSDFVRTRLTHSLEVSSFGKSLGQNIGERIIKEKKDSSFTPEMKEAISDILQCAGLIHDIGNPPFGHFGEEAIRAWFQENLGKIEYKNKPIDQLLTAQMRGDFYHFEGNAQALRLVTKLHYLVDENGMNLTFALLNTIIKYPGSSLEIRPFSNHVSQKKMGYYYADQDIFHQVTEATSAYNHRHPLTFVLEAADDLAYLTADIEDAFVKGMLPYETLLNALVKLEQRGGAGNISAAALLEHYHKRGNELKAANPKAYAVKNWIVRIQAYLIGCATDGFMEQYEEIMNGTFERSLFQCTKAYPLLEVLKELANQYVFTSETIYRLEITEAVMLDDLLHRFVKAILYYDTKERMGPLDERLVFMISENYKKSYLRESAHKTEEEKLYLRLLLVTDYICGMTDSYAKRLYQELNGMEG